MVPRHRKRPPHQRPQNRLPQRQRQNIPFARKQPRHRHPAHECQRHQHRIRPVQPSKQNARQQRRRRRLLQRRQQTVRQKRIERHLLQHTKREIPHELPRLAQVCWQPLQHPQKQSRAANRRARRRKKHHRTPCRRPKIVPAPSHHLRCVPPQQKTRHQPHHEHPPRLRQQRLPPPDVPPHIRDESQRFQQAGNPPRAPAHHQFSTADSASPCRISIIFSTLSNNFSISASETSSGARNSFKSKSGNPRFVIRAGSNSRSFAEGTAPIAAISSNTVRFSGSVNNSASSKPANSTRVTGFSSTEHNSRSVFLSNSSCSAITPAIFPPSPHPPHSPPHQYYQLPASNRVVIPAEPGAPGSIFYLGLGFAFSCSVIPTAAARAFSSTPICGVSGRGVEGSGHHLNPPEQPGFHTLKLLHS